MKTEPKIGHSLSALFSEPVERLEQQAGFQVVPA
jgi:hypothetical protein